MRTFVVPVRAFGRKWPISFSIVRNPKGEICIVGEVDVGLSTTKFAEPLDRDLLCDLYDEISDLLIGRM